MPPYAKDTVQQAEFAARTEPYRSELVAHCYRMVGSIHDAEDLVQDAYVRAWRAFGRFEGRSSVRRWLYAIATRVCLTALESRSRRPLPSGLGAPSDDHRVAVAGREPSVPWLQPAPDALFGAGDPAGIVSGRAGVRLAFIAALQYLPARQRAVLTLRDVLAFRTAEVAEILGSTPAAVDSALRRARARLAEAGPVQDDLSDPDEETRRTLLDRYVDAFTRADAAALVELLRVDAELEMPPTPTWFTGRRAVVGFLAHRVLRADRWRLVPTLANGQPAAVAYHHTGDGRHEAYGVQVLTLIGGRVARITAFNDPSLVPTFAPTTEPSRHGEHVGPVCDEAVACGLSAGRGPGRILGSMTKPAALKRHLPTSPFKARVAPAPKYFAVGDQVTHDMYGLGRVVGVEEGVAVLVDFGSAQERILSPYSKMTKL